MISLKETLYKSLNEGCYKSEKSEEEEVESIKSKKDFINYAHNKFKIVFGDKLDKERMEFTIKGILDDNKKLVDDGEWGELVGKLNKSFGS